MAFAEIEIARIKKAIGGLCKRRTSPEIRDQLRLEYSVKRHDIELYEVRPRWDDPSEEMNTPVAKIRFVRTTNEWRLFWMRQDLKWHSYQPFSSSRNLEEVAEVIDRDELSCFFG